MSDTAPAAPARSHLVEIHRYLPQAPFPILNERTLVESYRDDRGDLALEEASRKARELADETPIGTFVAWRVMQRHDDTKLKATSVFEGRSLPCGLPTYTGGSGSCKLPQFHTGRCVPSGMTTVATTFALLIDLPAGSIPAVEIGRLLQQAGVRIAHLGRLEPGDTITLIGKEGENVGTAKLSEAVDV
jgi:hypothetical protein